jgi:hypothetical protein
MGANQRLLDIVTQSVLITHRDSARRTATERDRLTVALNNGDPVAVRSSPLLLLTVEQILQTVEIPTLHGQHWLSSVVGYIYAVQLQDLTELVAYHWHPGASGGVDHPHLHFGPAAARSDSAVRPREMHKVHFPTGEVPLAAFLRLAITEFGVEPRRPDWEAILTA